jgi:hypothetical protein
LLCWVGVHCGIYNISYTISYFNSPLYHSPIFHPSPTPGIGIIFPFTYMCSQYFHHTQVLIFFTKNRCLLCHFCGLKLPCKASSAHLTSSMRRHSSCLHGGLPSTN